MYVFLPSEACTQKLEFVDQNYGVQGSGTASNYSYSKRRTSCYVCHSELYENEIDFYPCNCKYTICFDCYNRQVEEKDKKCPNCYKLYDVLKISEYLRKSNHQIQQLQSTQEIHKSPSQNKRTSSDNYRHSASQSKLSSVRILQKHILYVIGISPSIAKDEILRKYEYFGQYGRINQITINKDKAYKSENQGICYSVYICYSSPFEASIAILAVDQFVLDNRLIRASFGRTKYCKFFLKETQCLNKECPYQHTYCNGNEVLTQDDMQKKQLFQQCTQIAIEISKIAQIPEIDFKAQIRSYREAIYFNYNPKTVMPTAESIFQNKSLFKSINSQANRTMALSNQSSLNAIHSSRRVTNKDPAALQSNNNTQGSAKDLILSHHQSLDQKTQRQSIQPLTLTHFSSEVKGEALRYSQPQPHGIQKEIYVKKEAPQKPNVANQEQDQKKLTDIVPLTIKQEDLDQQAVKRNNSSDERRKPNHQEPDCKGRVQTYEQQLANSLRKHLAPQNQQDQSKLKNEGISTSQSISIFNEKKTSRFLSLKDENEENGADDQSLLLSRRSSVAQTLHQKKASNQSLLIDNVLKFLNDDTDVVPAKREPLIAYKYNPPSEVQNVATSTYSHLGGNEEEQWNNTIFSQQEYRVYQQTYGMCDEKSYYSHGLLPQMRINNTGSDLKNSFVANSFQNFNGNWQQKSAQFNDSQQMNTLSQNFIRGVGYVGHSNYIPQLSQQVNSNSLRKTTFIQNNQSNFESGVQLPRSPSQPRIDNSGLMNQSQPNVNFNQIRQQMSNNTFQSQKGFGVEAIVDPFGKRQIPIQANMSMNANQMSRLHSISFDKQKKPLNQQNFDTASKDLLYANIFRQDGVASNNNVICSQSLFCYNFDDDYYDDNGWQKNKNKLAVATIKNVPRTPVREKKTMFGFTNDDYDFSQFDEDNTTTKNSEPKNYYKEFLSVKECFGAQNIFGKRRNSLDEDREKLQPQQLQFNSPFKMAIDLQEEEGKVQPPAEKRSKSRSQQRHLTQTKEVLGYGYQRD